MRRIFLTSGLVLCLACPAFADISAGTSSADCTESVLGATSGSVDFSSEWRPMISAVITLNNGRWTSNSGSSVQNTTTAAAPTTLYAIYGVGVYSDQPTVGTLDNFTTSNRLTSLTTTPQMTGYTFAGVYTTPATGGTQVINASGNFIYDAASTQFSNESTANNWYTRWNPNTYTVTYNSGSCTDSPNTTVYTDTDGATYNSNYTVPAAANSAITVKTGYTFVGWNTVTGQTTSNFPDASATPWTRTGGITVYAACSLNSFTISYGCGSAPSGASETVSGDTPPSNGTAIYGSAYTLSSSYGNCTLPGYHATGWDCTGGATLTNATGSQNANTWSSAANISCTVHWTANTISLNYYPDTAENGGTSTFTTGSCTYDTTFNLPSSNLPTKNGYHFNGWNIREPVCNLSDLNINEPSASGYIADPNGDNMDGLSSNANTYGLTESNTWGVSFSNGIATGQALCSVTYGNAHGATGNPSSTSGNHCWCRATGYTVNGGSQCEISSSSWVFDETLSREPDGNCLGKCAMRCAFKVYMQTGIETPLFSGQ